MARALSRTQRALLLAGALLIAGTIWLFVSLMNKPDFVTLYSGLKAGEAQTLAARLAAKNIAYQLSPDGGSLQVPATQLDGARLETAAQGLPRNARLGFELFDTPNWAGSDFSERVNYQRALEGELERTLQTLDEVESARVHLVLPEESLFAGQEREAKAAVILKTRGGRLSEQAQRAIPRLVASAVEGLRPGNVTVVDADSNTPLLRQDGGDGSAAPLEEAMARTLVTTLAPVVGADHARASVHVEFDLGSSENTEEIYDPKASATLTEQKSEENAGGALPAGIPGTASNVPGGTAATTGTSAASAMSGDAQTSRSESLTYAVSKSVRHSTQPPGRIKRIAAAVLVDDALDPTSKTGAKPARRKRSPEEMKQLEQLASAAIGLDIQRGDVLTVENLTFEQPSEEKLPAPTRLEIVRRVVGQWTGVLRYIGVTLLFLLAYFLMLRPIKKQILVTLSQLPGSLGQRAKNLAAAGATEGVVETTPELEQTRRAATLKKQLAERVKSEPAAASRLVRSWMRDGEQS
jgi:flagellar M-ring protein FliF